MKPNGTTIYYKDVNPLFGLRDTALSDAPPTSGLIPYLPEDRTLPPVTDPRNPLDDFIGLKEREKIPLPVERGKIVIRQLESYDPIPGDVKLPKTRLANGRKPLNEAEGKKSLVPLLLIGGLLVNMIL